ncbi:MAG: ABC transporter ATP-binding protein [Actinomycetota bacterium]
MTATVTEPAQDGDDNDASIDALDGAPTVQGGAIEILRRGVAASPELTVGLRATVIMGLGIAVSRLVIPVLLQRAIDQGILADEGVDTGAVLRSAALIGLIVFAAAAVAYMTTRRLVRASEATLAGLRRRAFRKVHQLSIADHNETRRGVLLARVTSDVEGLARFAQWGLYAWAVNPTVIVGTLLVMAWYSWQLTLVVLLCYSPVIPALRWLQRHQLAAYDKLRTAVAEMVASFSEVINGLPVLQAYGATGLGRRRVGQAVDERYRRAIIANRYMSGVFVVGDFFGALALSGVVFVGVSYSDTLGLGAGDLVAIMFLTTLLLEPTGEIAETLDQTQTAVASWRKILNLLDRPIEVVEAEPGRSVPEGPVAIDVETLTFAYRGADPVLHQVDLRIEAGSNVAIVGHTGSGKSTIAKLLCRLADPQQGEIRLNGVPLAEVGPDARLATVRMVPQDGFLFDTTVRENIRFGRLGATDVDIAGALATLSLENWVERLPNGLDTRVGERGTNLSVGERQLVALVRAALADPGLLILDEATSAVDPETDQVLTTAIRRLAQGRTIVSIAHRLATAEAADVVVVFDAGRITEMGPHDQLVDAGGHYTDLHQAWIGATE